MPTRQENLQELRYNTGGDSWGLWGVGMAFAALSGPQKTLPTCLLIGISGREDVEKLTDDEVEKLVDLSHQATEQHKRSVGQVLLSDNLITVRKTHEGRWQWRRRTWTAPLVFDTLEQVKKSIIR